MKQIYNSLDPVHLEEAQKHAKRWSFAIECQESIPEVREGILPRKHSADACWLLDLDSILPCFTREQLIAFVVSLANATDNHVDVHGHCLVKREIDELKRHGVRWFPTIIDALSTNQGSMPVSAAA